MRLRDAAKWIKEKITGKKTVRQSSAKKTENSGGACAYAAEKKKTTHDTICPVDHINHCSNCRNPAEHYPAG